MLPVSQPTRVTLDESGIPAPPVRASLRHVIGVEAAAGVTTVAPLADGRNGAVGVPARDADRQVGVVPAGSLGYPEPARVAAGDTTVKDRIAGVDPAATCGRQTASLGSMHPDSASSTMPLGLTLRAALGDLTVVGCRSQTLSDYWVDHGFAEGQDLIDVAPGPAEDGRAADDVQLSPLRRCDWGTGIAASPSNHAA